ncbi:hypothetical protein MCB86_09020 [Pseudomonas sp. KSR10]|uniref:hypothetical protein n=1 Tax=Pseudomonas sp. KSR10 TaxID=2916654 RepID=UPI001EF7CBAC|nr:hypothetical protein [Pseudomonas sp. KSR10]MCG6540215.1 hypothetical protein [Pseudomonas sp. KSR10]
MIKEVKRYAPWDSENGMVEHQFGNWVDADDYEALLAERDQLRSTLIETRRLFVRDTDELIAERDALRDENANLQTRLTGMTFDRNCRMEERDALKKVLDRQVPLHDAIQRAAGDLPEGWEIRLCVEHHAGWVELIGPDGSEDFATNDERLDYTVIDALEHALQGAQPCT